MGLTHAQPQVAQVPGVVGVTVIWPELQAQERAANFRQPGGASGWHTDLVVRMLVVETMIPDLILSSLTMFCRAKSVSFDYLSGKQT
jgi:hypothetical protein